MNSESKLRKGILAWLQHWIMPRVADDDTALRAQAIYALTLPMMIVLVIFVAFSIATWIDTGQSPASSIALAADLIVLVALALIYVLARRGVTRISMVLLVGINLIAVAAYMYAEGYQSLNAMLLLVAVVAAGLTLGARASFAIATLSIALYGLIAWAESQGWLVPSFTSSAFEDIISFMLLIYMSAGLASIFGNWAYETQRGRARALAEQMEAMAATNREKDALMQAIHDQVDEQQALLNKLEAAAQSQVQLTTALRLMSSPAIPIFDQVIVMPIAGPLSAERARQVLQDLLDGVERHDARLAILDITAAPEIDEAAANGLLQAVDALGLLGAECVLVGIRPDMSRALIALGADLGGIVSRRDLQSGVEYALSRIGRKVVDAS